MRPARFGAAALTAILGTTLPTGCGTATPEGAGTNGTDRLDVEVPAVADAEAPLTDGGAWWGGGVLHLDGREQELGGLRSFAVAHRTVAYVDPDGHVCFTDLTETSCTDLEAYGDLVVSPDGMHLGFLEESLGEKDEYDTSLMTTVVLDLGSGEAVLSSGAGMGDPATDDLAALYGDASPAFASFTGSGDPVVSPASSPLPGDIVLPVGGGEPTAAGRDDLVARDLPGRTIRVRRTGGDVEVRPGTATDTTQEGLLSPDEQQVVVGPVGYRAGLLATPAPGGRLQPFTGQEEQWWTFGTWTGPHAFLATTLDPDQATYRVYRCDAAVRTCALEGELPTDDAGIDAVVFPTVTGSDVVSLGSYA